MEWVALLTIAGHVKPVPRIPLRTLQKESSVIQSTALFADSMIGTEVIVWTAVLVGLFFFHSLLNIVMKTNRATESEDRLEYR
jgi:hypothetical protein